MYRIIELTYIDKRLAPVRGSVFRDESVVRFVSFTSFFSAHVENCPVRVCNFLSVPRIDTNSRAQGLSGLTYMKSF